MRRLLILMGVAALATFGVACAEDPAEDTEVLEAPEDAEEEDSGEGASGTVTAANAAFDPVLISVQSGGSIEFVNEDDFEHSFTVQETDVSEELEEPGSVTVDLSSLDEGSYTFFCEYHPDTMEGTLEIIP